MRSNGSRINFAVLGMVTFWLFSTLFSIAVTCGCVYVLFHFILKFW